MNEIKITNTNGVLTVSSLQVARDFGKRHDHVIRDIEILIGMIKGGFPKIGETPLEKGLKSKISDYFIETKYQHPQNKQWYKCYDVTRDGFSLLVMGFTGQKALEWKLKYIEAFNSMERQLININSDIDKYIDKMLDERIETVIDRVFDKKMNDIIKAVKETVEKTSYETVNTLIPCFLYTHKKLKRIYKKLKK